MEIRVVYLNIFVLINFIYQTYCLEPVPQVKDKTAYIKLAFIDLTDIKVVGTQISGLSSEYINKMVYTVNRINATFNYLKIFWNLKKDFPADLKVYTKVYVTTTTYQKGALILEDVTPVCEPSNKRELLPNIFQVRESDLNGQCIRKGIYVLENFVQYRFEVLVPDIELKGNYYRVDYKFGNNDTLISKFTFYNEWGYHNTY